MVRVTGEIRRSALLDAKGAAGKSSSIFSVLGTPKQGAQASLSADDRVVATRPMIGASVQPGRCSAQILLPDGSRR